MTLFLGWDVGAWNCGQGKSQDALCLLEGTSFADLRIAVPPWRGNVREAIVEDACPTGILSVLRLESVPTCEFVVGIDTPLGWPEAFGSLLAGDTELPHVNGSVTENPYVFRCAERALVSRGLFPRGRTPLSSVRDMIGSQSTKGLYFLRKATMRQEAPSVWRKASWTVIETYPTPVRTSRMLQPHFERLAGDPMFVKRTRLGKHVAADINDSLWCALVAATWTFAPGTLVKPPEDDVIATEGWIWVPSDCCTPTEVADDEAVAGEADE